MTSVRYSVDGGAWNFSIHSSEDTSLGSSLCTADTVEVETYLINDKCEIFCGRWSLEFLHTQQ